MSNTKIKFGFNHMIYPALTPEQLVDAAVSLGAAAIELRIDIGANSIADVETARRVGRRGQGKGH